ncbi:hypothetical protein Fmac_008603 [Flemingia macrophylla]|uniref:Uncharacterized protein n=1 Tax=Flemingia macrophylla TaxID=520843 RepID=A0ABD1MXW2_9FABA
MCDADHNLKPCFAIGSAAAPAISPPPIRASSNIKNHILLPLILKNSHNDLQSNLSVTLTIGFVGGQLG